MTSSPPQIIAKPLIPDNKAFNKPSFKHEQASKTIAKCMWHKAFNSLKKRGFVLDPWHNFKHTDSTLFDAIRYRYSAIKKKWVQDDVQVKIENESFDRGAMRECFRLKKLPSHGDWNFSSNYVAKKYIETVPRDTYFDDVHLQMEAKLWGEAFNRCNPPKKVDIFQLSIIEVKDGDKIQFYHIERFMEGEYRKYNSNSGFVDEQLRNTPQTFSHFTFERSGHRLMIVDIQGVGDLYTDPQIHTADGVGYSDGNLGLRGMALFFHTHRCNPICEHFGLAPFDLSEKELLEEHPTHPTLMDLKTISEELLIETENPNHNNFNEISINALLTNSTEFLDITSESSELPHLKQTHGRRRTVSCNTSRDSVLANNSSHQNSARISRIFGPTVVRGSHESLLRFGSNFDSPLSQAHSLELPIVRDRAFSGDSGIQTSDPLQKHLSFHEPQHDSSAEECNWSPQFIKQDPGIFNFTDMADEIRQMPVSRRYRGISESSDIDFEIMHDSANQSSPNFNAGHLALHHYHHLMHETRKPASADHPTNLDQEIGQSILGQIHHELARLHEAGRFIKGRECLAWSPGRRKHPSLGRRRTQEASLKTLDLDNPNGSHTETTASQLDWGSVLFHEKHAAQLGCLEAMIVMAHYYLGLPSTLLFSCPIEAKMGDLSHGIDYLWRAAEGGDRRCMILLARYLDTYAEGNPEHSKEANDEWGRFVTTPSHLIVLPKLAEAMQNKEAKGDSESCDLPAIQGNPWSEACVWYRKAVDSAAARNSNGTGDSVDKAEQNEACDENGGLDAEGRYDAADDLLPVHRLLARIAELHIIGGHGLMRDPLKAGYIFNEAGEAAQLLMQGQLAMRYFELAEEAWALLPEDEQA